MRWGKFIHYPTEIKNLKIIWILASVLIWFISTPVNGQISPGDLTSAHSKLEGISNCTNCHELGEKATNSKCLGCHKEMQSLINKNLGYHSSSDVRGKECASCHSEHNGRKFQIIRFDKNKFNHDKNTSFLLTGKHKELNCTECHQQKFILNNDLKKRKSTYLGLNKSCLSCHEDYHMKTLGSNCDNCHNTESFRPAPLFNHDKSKYKLTGEHKKVECIKCHIKENKNGKEFQKFKNIPFGKCTSCHNDFHKGKFGSNCESCHSTAGFKKVNTSLFNHDKTSFPLIGKHISVNCASCHGQNLASRPAHNYCIDCHKDYHNGQFITTDKKIKDCKYCHSENGFSPSEYTIDNHQKLKFKLKGSHLAVSCKSCHWKNQNWKFKNIGDNCTACHINVHGNEISKVYLGDDNCQNCHNVNSWKEINFNHSKTNFSLLGKHTKVNCIECHTVKNENNIISYKFSSLKPDCETCHKDIHFGQFKQGYNNDCMKCHSFNNWKPEKFDHEKTKFSLKGAHEKLTCDKCHKQETAGPNKFIKFKLEEFKCATCHLS